MVNRGMIREKFESYGGVLRTSELSALGLSSRQIRGLLDEGVISRIKHGYYELSGHFTREDVIIARLFPDAVLYLESALLHYEYTDRVPPEWQIAVDKHTSTSKFDIEYPRVTPFFIDHKFLELGVGSYHADGIAIRIYDRDRTICDVLRYEKKLGREVFNNAIQRYLRDTSRNIRNLLKYADVLNIRGKVRTYIEVWL